MGRDARLVAIGSKDGTVHVSQARGGKLTAKVNLDSTLVRLALSRDGKLLATASEDKRIRIINISDQKQLARIPTDGTLSRVEFDDLARYLRIVRRTGDSIVAEQYPLDQALIHDVCSRLTRNLTQSEWQQHLPGDRPRITCVNLESHPVDVRGND
jgi:tricorn protease-like protein